MNPHNNFKNSINKTINKGLLFIDNQQHKDGSWSDFYSKHHGQSIDWVTAYVANCLINAGLKPRKLKKTAQFLAQRQNCGWGYNEIAQQDADSTAEAILFLNNYPANYATEINNGLEFLIGHQKESGGFGTYLEKNIRRSERFPKEISVDGWCGECVDVTLNAITALKQYKIYCENVQKAEIYLDNLIQKNNIHSYWWESDIPVKLELLHSNIVNQNEILELYKSKNRDLTAYENALFLYYLDDRGFSDIKKTIATQLIYSQNKYGGWNGGAILRFPHPSNKEPWIDSNRWRDICNDHNGIYTTATIIKALSNYVIEAE
jgi:hypothetical protein